VKLALIALLVAAPPPAERPCLTHAQLEDLAMFALPPLIEAVAAKCAAHLPAQAYLLNGGRRLATSLGAESAARGDSAMATLRAMSGEMPSGISAETMRSMVRDMATSEIKLKPEECTRVDRAGELLAPLPPRNLAGIVVMLAELGMDKDAKKKPPFTICPAP
jgi:hypothetical protein